MALQMDGVISHISRAKEAPTTGDGAQLVQLVYFFVGRDWMLHQDGADNLDMQNKAQLRGLREEKKGPWLFFGYFYGMNVGIIEKPL